MTSAGPLLGADWTLVAHNAVSSTTEIDTLKIAMASNGTALSGAGILAEIHFEAADWRRAGSTPLVLEHVLFNDGTPGHAAAHGVLRIVGADAALQILPQQVVPPDTLALNVADEDENRDHTSADLVAVRIATGANSELLELVESGSSTAVFEGSIPVAQAGNGIIETALGEVIAFCYDDSLDARGQAVERCAMV